MADAPIEHAEVMRPIARDFEEDLQMTNFKSCMVKSLFGVVAHPLHVSKTLTQLGYEPFPLTMGNVFIFGGRQAYFLPNGFSYMKQLAQANGWQVLFKGADAFFLANFLFNYTKNEFLSYLDTEYPDFGGVAVKNAEDFTKLDTRGAFSTAWRSTVRDLAASTVATVISRPFTVIFVREVAQIIGGESKYTHVISSLYKIGHEEGPKGFFSGLTAAIVGTGAMVVATHVLSFAIDRLILQVPVDPSSTQEDHVEKTKKTRGIIHKIIPFAVGNFSYPYQVVATVMSVAGSNLLCSLLPYTPPFYHWQDVHSYLGPVGVTRGARMFMREQKGAILVGPNNVLYANNKYIS
uniref:Mitochondrial carrier protein n=1 Tax=Rhabditophanes sp. KR3021 TaxID=114890 RepID=A0AC35TQ39_9BILA